MTKIPCIQVAMEDEDDESLQCVEKSKDVEEGKGSLAHSKCAKDPSNAQ